MTIDKASYNRLNQATAHLCEVIVDAIGSGGRSEDPVTLGALDILALEQIRNTLDNFITIARTSRI